MNQIAVAKQMRKAIEFLCANFNTEQAAEVCCLYPAWKAPHHYSAEENGKQADRCQYNGKLYSCRQSHTSQEQHTPDLIPAIWEIIAVTQLGTADDPITASVNMIYEEGKYYWEDGVIYLCIRDSVIPLSYLPSDLIDQYFRISNS